jgi:two-component system chemotaxis sensor kinase CheA
MAEVDEFVVEFLKESFEHLDCFDADLLMCRSAAASEGDVQRMFRAIHTIKGVCGFLGFSRLEAVTTPGEGVIGKVRDGERALDTETLDALVALAVVVREIMDNIAVTGDEPAGDDAALLARLDTLQTVAG